MSCTQLTGAQVITMAPNRPVAERVDILVEDDSIAEMADHIDCPPAETVDLSGRIEDLQLFDEIGSGQFGYTAVGEQMFWWKHCSTAGQRVTWPKPRPR
jgi:hypothetical protein